MRGSTKKSANENNSQPKRSNNEVLNLSPKVSDQTYQPYVSNGWDSTSSNSKGNYKNQEKLLISNVLQVVIDFLDD